MSINSFGSDGGPLDVSSIQFSLYGFHLEDASQAISFCKIFLFPYSSLPNNKTKPKPKHF